MYCLHPIEVAKWIEDSNGKKVKSANYHLCPCGKCVACLSRLRNSWTYRLTMEQEHSDYSYFVTLTYDDYHVPKNDKGLCFRKKDVQDFLKRLRYYLHEVSSDLQITYYCISEFGSQTKRPHYHMLIFVKNDKYRKFCKTIIPDIIRDNWDIGWTVIKSTTPANIHYVTKYSVKSLNADLFNDDLPDKPFVLCSKKNYLGSGAFHELENSVSRSGSSFVFLSGKRLPMPRIFRDKIGVGSLNQPLSQDPRLSRVKFDKWKADYIRKNGAFDQVGFMNYVNSRFYAIEQNAIRHQIKKIEKL